MIRLLLPFCALGMAAAAQPSPTSQRSGRPTLEEARAEYLRATNAYSRFLEEREAMKSRLRKKRIASDDEVDFYGFQVASARFNLAQLHNKPTEAAEQLRAAITVRENQYDRLERLRTQGIGSDAEIDIAQRQLASSRYRSAHLEGRTEEALQQLKRIEEIAARELNRERRFGRQTPTPPEAEESIYRVSKARYLQAKLKGQKKGCAQFLQEMATLTGSTLARLRKLQMQGSSSEEEIEWAMFRDLIAQQRVAISEGKKQQALEKQQELADLANQMLRRAQRSSHGTEEEKEYLKWEAALQRYRLAQAEKGTLTDYEPIWDLDGATHISHEPQG
jgi:hypothetical protein